MFKQFTENIKGNEVYLISSLGLFLVFFIVVAILLILVRRNHIKYMSDLPLNDGVVNPERMPI